MNIPGSFVSWIFVSASRWMVSPPSKPASACQTRPSESVNGASAPAFTR
jgi:hypothetical protein